MKALQKLLGGVLILNMLLGSVAFAATAPASLALPNSFVYMELDTTKENPLEQHFKVLLDRLIAEDVDNSQTLEAISQNIDNTQIGFSTTFHKSDLDTLFLLSITMPESDFQAIVDSLEGGDLTKNDVGKDRIIYLTDGDFYFSYKDGNLLAASREGLISDLLNQTAPDSISKHPDFQYLTSKSSPESFLKFFINFENIPDMDATEMMIGDTTIVDLVKSEGFSLTQTANGFTGLVTVAPGTEFPLQSDKYSFTPDLYKKTSAKNILLYSESFKWAENLKDSLTLLMSMQDSDMEVDAAEIFQEIADSIVEVSGLDPETDMAPLFQNRSSFAVHTETDQQYFPTFTIVSEVDGQESLANASLDKLHAHVLNSVAEGFDAAYERELEWRVDMEEWYADSPDLMPTPLPDKEEARKHFYTESSATVDGITYNQITINTDASPYSYFNNYELEITPDPLATWVLSTAVTSDGLMIITSKKDLSSVIATDGGLSNDSEWASNFQSKSAIEVSYINISTLSEYIAYLGNLSGGDVFEITEILDFLSAFKSIYGHSTFADGYFAGEFKLNMDMTKLEQIQEGLGAFIDSLSERTLGTDNNFAYEELKFLSQENRFWDVDNDTWFAEHVEKMDRMNIMSGYNNNEFRPGQNITRAEFIKSVMATWEQLGYTLLTDTGSPFSDVPSYRWYTPYVNTAHQLGLVEGYEDGTFRPDQPITRAEAAVIIANLLDDLLVSTGSPRVMQFNDVQTEDWFKDEVQKAFNADLVTGKNNFTFAPHDNLTRAETATLLSRLIEYYYNS